MTDTVANQASAQAEEPRFEMLLHELEGLVDKLERGELSLEEALASFERGMTLVKAAGGILEKAEMKVDLLLAERDGSAREVPYNGAPSS